MAFSITLQGPRKVVNWSARRWRLLVIAGLVATTLIVFSVASSFPRIAQRAMGASTTDIPCTRDIVETTAKPVELTLNRKWHLIGKEIISNNPVTILANVPRPTNCNMGGYTIDVSITDRATTEFSLAASRKHEISIPLSELTPGTYSVTANLKSGTDVITSVNTKFNVSYPVYVAWTLDWEGYGFPVRYLDELQAATNKKTIIPLTHFFNARYFTATDFNAGVASRYLQWIKERQKLYGDEIGMHVHLFYDFVEQAGVLPRSTPAWNNRGTGSDVPLSSYTRDEQRAILRYSLVELAKKGLTDFKSFRAPGWFADETTMEVLRDLGFIIDSSGRTAARLGGWLELPWTLKPTTQPYVMCTFDQNKGCKPNNNTMVQVPNNGGDSAQFSSPTLIERFFANYNKQPQATHRLVTLLTHPETWYREKANIVPALDEIDKHSYAADAGPVLYTTVYGAHNIWQQNNLLPK